MAATTTNGSAGTGGAVRADARARRFARLWRHLERSVDELAAAHKDELLADLPERVVELGPGCGANLTRYRAGTTVVAVEPNPWFHDDLRAAAERAGVALDLVAGELADAGLPDASVDAVVSTFVLCSVADRRATLAEVVRVLRPGGRFLFVEHVAAPAGTGVARYQRILRRPWRALGDGCDPCAATVDDLRASGLALDARHDRIGPVLDPTHPVWWGTGRTPGAPVPGSPPPPASEAGPRGSAE